MSKTVAQLLVDTLAEHGVRQIFGVVGDALDPLTEAIRKDGRLEWVGVRHEEGAALAAAGQAKLTGRLAVCAGTTGPGGNHLVAGLYEACRDHAPVLALSGGQPGNLRGTEYIQTADHTLLFRDVSVSTAALDSAENAAGMIHEAIAHAYAGPGVGHLVIPQDIIGATTKSRATSAATLRPLPELQPAEDDLRQAAALLDKATSVAILVGTGARGAEVELIALADRLQAPLIHSFRAKDMLTHDQARWVGGVGLIGGRPGVDAVAHADLLLIVGSDYPYKEFLPSHGRVIQIDYRAMALGRRTSVALGIVGSARPALARLAELTAPKADTAFFDRSRRAQLEWAEKLDELADIDRDADLIHPQAVARLVGDLADPGASFVVDTGNVTLWCGNWIRIKAGQRLIASFNNAAVGTALGQANGIQALDRARQVIALCGDGGFTMLMGEFMTAIEHRLPIKVVVFNNGTWGMVHLEMEAAGNPATQGANFPNCDFAAFARACGGQGYTVKAPTELEPTLRQALATPGPVIVDVRVDPKELPVMPHVNLAQALGFGMAKIKEAIGL